MNQKLIIQPYHTNALRQWFPTEEPKETVSLIGKRYAEWDANYKSTIKLEEPHRPTPPHLRMVEAVKKESPNFVIFHTMTILFGVLSALFAGYTKAKSENTWGREKEMLERELFIILCTLVVSVALYSIQAFFIERKYKKGLPPISGNLKVFEVNQNGQPTLAIRLIEAGEERRILSSRDNLCAFADYDIELPDCCVYERRVEFIKLPKGVSPEQYLNFEPILLETEKNTAIAEKQVQEQADCIKQLLNYQEELQTDLKKQKTARAALVNDLAEARKLLEPASYNTHGGGVNYPELKGSDDQPAPPPYAPPAGHRAYPDLGGDIYANDRND